MTMFRIKEHLDVLENVLSGVSCHIGFPPDPHRFEKKEKAIGNSIVPKGQVVVTIASTPHTWNQIMGVEKRLPLLT